MQTLSHIGIYALDLLVQALVSITIIIMRSQGILSSCLLTQ